MIIALLVSAVSVFPQNCPENAKVVAPSMSADARAENVKNIEAATLRYEAEPTDENLIWVGRRVAYLGRYKDAIGVFSKGIERFPKDARFYRHRGHRYITIRCFDDAIKDFEKAAALIKGKPDEIEPDGMPNARNIPTSTLQSNIWYHLGLAYYLKGHFGKALKAYENCQKVSKNNDMRVATTYWHYMTLRRMGKRSKAEKLLKGFPTDIEIIENADYLNLLKLNKGEARAENLLSTIRGDANTLGSASLGYGIGNYFLYNGDMEKAVTIFRQIVAGNQWSSFGFIAAETDLLRTRNPLDLVELQRID